MGIKALQSFQIRLFVQFLSGTLFEKVYNQKPDLETITVIYDEMDELGSRSNDCIAIIYDFEFGKRNIFYLESKMAHIVLKDTPLASNQLTKQEINYYQQYQMLMGVKVGS